MTIVGGAIIQEPLLLHLVCKLNMLPHGAWVGVAPPTSWMLAGIRFASDVRLHVLGSVACVVEPLATGLIVTDIGLLPRVRANVQLEILKPGEAAIASGDVAFVRLLSRVASQVSNQLVASVEWLHASAAALPLARVFDHGQCVFPIQVRDQA